MSVYNSLTDFLKKDSRAYEQSEEYKSFSAADRLFEDLVTRGLAERRGNRLMPPGNRFSIDTKINA